VKISKGLKQAYDLQDFTYSAILALKGSLTDEGGKLRVTRADASAIAQLSRAWEMTQERIRIHRNKPLPGSFKPEKPTPKRKPYWVPSPTLDDAPLANETPPG
jgi:hypothetical protein